VGAWKVIGYAGLTEHNRAALWRCICRNCGSEAVFTGTRLRKRIDVKPCPCLTPEQRRKRNARLMRLAARAKVKQR